MFATTLMGDDGVEETVLYESTGAGQDIPGFDTEQEMVIGLESELKEFYYLFDDMKTVGGMNQQLALEMHRLIPESAQKYPVGYFTKQATATLYRPALEELHEGVWALIGAAALAITVMIWKFVRWVTGKSSDELPEPKASGSGPSDSQLSGAIKDAESAANKRNNVIDEIAGEQKNIANMAPGLEAAAVQVVGDARKNDEQEGRRAANDATGGDGKKGGSVSIEEVTDMILDLNKHKHLYDLVYQKNNAYYDIMVDGPWSKLILALGPATMALEQAIGTQMEALKQIMDNPRLFNSDQANAAGMKRHIEQLNRGFTFSNEHFHNLDELQAAVGGAKSKMAVNTANHRIIMTHASRKMDAFINSKPFLDLKFMSAHAAAGLERVARVRSELDNLMRINRPRPDQGANGTLPVEVSRELSKSIHTLIMACGVFVQAIAQVEYFIEMVLRFIADQSLYWQSMTNAVELFNKRSPHPVEFPKEFEEGRKTIGFLKGLFSKLPKKHKF